MMDKDSFMDETLQMKQNINTSVSRILEYLDFHELMKCKRVCPLWKKIANEIENNKVFILTEKILVLTLRESIHNPEKLLQYLKISEEKSNGIVSEYPLYPVKDCIICKTCGKRKYLSEKSQLEQKFLNENSNTSHFWANYLTTGEFITKTAIFPLNGGIKIYRFAYYPKEIQKFLRIGLFEDGTKVPPKDEIKCILWFLSDQMDARFLSVFPKCAMGGVTEFGGLHLHQCIIFCGSRINAASLKLYSNLQKNKKFSPPKFSEEQIGKLRRYNIDQKKCVAFMFSQHHDECNSKHTLSNFKKHFPDVPVLFYRSLHHFGYEYMPPTNVDDTETVKLPPTLPFVDETIEKPPTKKVKLPLKSQYEDETIENFPIEKISKKDFHTTKVKMSPKVQSEDTTTKNFATFVLVWFS